MGAVGHRTSPRLQDGKQKKTKTGIWCRNARNLTGIRIITVFGGNVIWLRISRKRMHPDAPSNDV